MHTILKMETKDWGMEEYDPESCDMLHSSWKGEYPSPVPLIFGQRGGERRNGDRGRDIKVLSYKVGYQK